MAAELVKTIPVILRTGQLAIINETDFDPMRHSSVRGDKNSEAAQDRGAKQMADYAKKNTPKDRRSAGGGDEEDEDGQDARLLGLPARNDGVRREGQNEMDFGGRRVILHAERAPSDVPAFGGMDGGVIPGVMKVRLFSNGEEALIMRGEFNPSLHQVLLDDPITQGSSFTPSPVDPLREASDDEIDEAESRTDQGVSSAASPAVNEARRRAAERGEQEQPAHETETAAERVNRDQGAASRQSDKGRRATRANDRAKAETKAKRGAKRGR
jgi:hypothetical protein